MKDIDKVREHLISAQKIFGENCTNCEFYHTAKVGLIITRLVPCCSHPDRDSEEDPMFMCSLPHCPLLS